MRSVSSRCDTGPFKKIIGGRVIKRSERVDVFGTRQRAMLRAPEADGVAGLIAALAAMLGGGRRPRKASR